MQVSDRTALWLKIGMWVVIGGAIILAVVLHYK